MIDKITFGEFTKDFYLNAKCSWLKRMTSKRHTCGDQHLEKKRGLLFNYFLPEFRNIYLQNISRRMIDDYPVDAKSQQSKHTSPLKACTKNMHCGFDDFDFVHYH